MEATTTTRLAEKPTTIVEARPHRLRADVEEVWAYRELLGFLAWRDIKVRYKQTLLGATWAILQPLLTMVVFSVVFGRVAGVKFGDVPYAVAVFAGLLPWTYFSQALTLAGGSLVGNAQLVSKVYFPRLVVPFAAIVAPLVDLAIALVILLALMAGYGIAPGVEILALPLFLLLSCATALGAGLFFAGLNVRYRDVRYALPFVVQLWLYASPVVYPLTMLPEHWRWLFSLNPMAAAIDGFRWSMLGQTPAPSTQELVAGSVVALLLSVSGVAVFRRVEREFADVI